MAGRTPQSLNWLQSCEQRVFMTSQYSSKCSGPIDPDNNYANTCTMADM
jgi:hypothetical protein